MLFFVFIDKMGKIKRKENIFLYEELMRFIKYSSKEEFLKDNLEILQKEEAKNEIMIGILQEHSEDKISNWFMGRVESGSEVKAIFLVEDDRKGLLLYSPEGELEDEICEHIILNIIENDIHLDEILTSEKNSLKLGKEYSKRVNKEMYVEQNMFVLYMDEIEENKLLKDDEKIEKLEKETVDYDILKKNIKEMYQDNFRGRECSDEEASKVAEAFLRKGIYVLKNGNNDIVSQAVTVRKQVNGCAIGGVITFNEYRGFGYATRLVYTLCQQLLKDKYKFVVLHVNSKNEAANAVYNKIGFRKIDETAKIKFIK